MRTIVSPRSRICAQHLPQLVDLGRREHRRRLVENENLRAAIERLENLDALRFADREVGDESLRARTASPVVATQLARPRARRARDRAVAPSRELAAEHHVLGDGERGDEHEVLMHHADAGVDRVGGRPAGDVAAVHFHAAGVRRVHAAQHAHERRLAGAVLADERVNLAARDLERRAAVGRTGPNDLWMSVRRIAERRGGRVPAMLISCSAR